MFLYLDFIFGELEFVNIIIVGEKCKWGNRHSRKNLISKFNF